MGTKVYVPASGWEKSYHRSPFCYRMTGKSPGWIARDLDEVDHPDLCPECFPEQPPKLKVIHRSCCSVHPCRHNGGVVVERIWRGRPQLYWVWPEHAHR